MSLASVMTLHKAVVRLSTIKGKKFIGNAFVVHYRSPDMCILMTCQHCVKDVKQVICKFHDDFEIVAGVSHMDKSRDVALLCAIVSNPYPPLQFLELQELLPEDEVVILGYLSMCSGTVMKNPAPIPGQIIGDPWIKKKEPDLIEFIQANYGSKGGMSGSPVFDEKMLQVAGMHSTAERGAKHAVSVRTIRKALQTWANGTSIPVLLEIIGNQLAFLQ